MTSYIVQQQAVQGTFMPPMLDIHTV